MEQELKQFTDALDDLMYLFMEIAMDAEYQTLVLEVSIRDRKHYQ